MPPYIIQEEFDRYTGFLWQPINGRSILRGFLSDHKSIFIQTVVMFFVSCMKRLVLPTSLFFCVMQHIQVDEGGVELVYTFDPASQVVDDYRYPRPGKQNAKSTLKLLTLKYTASQASL